MKKKLSMLLVLVFIMSLIAGCSSKGKAEEANVVAKVVALKGPTGMGIVKMISDESAKEEKDYEISIVNSVDEITPKIVNGEVDIAAVPANLASVLYNNTDGGVVTLAINTLGVLYVVENGNSINSIEDLRGKTIYSSGKGATPEYSFNYILEQSGIDPNKDVTVEYKSEHTECLAALLNDEDGVAVLPQPFVTTALSKNEDLRVALDLTEEWEALADDNDSTLLTGVVVARKEFVENYPQKVADFLENYKASVEFTNENIDEAAKLIDENGIVAEAIAKKAIPECNITYIDGKDMEVKLSAYLKVLYDANPKSVGGKLPDEAFYYIQEK